MDLGRSEVVGDRRLRLANSSPDVKALFNSPAYVYNLDDSADSSYMAGALSDYWTPLAPIVCISVASWHLVVDCKQGSGIPSRTKQADDSLKRGSDSLLEAKLKEQIKKPLSLTNRAQSLDLTKSFSRFTGDSSSSFAPPESPTTSTGDTGGNSSPTSVSFPCVYDPTMSSGTAVIGSSSQLGNAADVGDIDEVSRVISNLGL